MIKIEKRVYNELVEYSQRCFSEESCGILAGRGNRVEKFYPMKNTDKSKTSFFMEPKEQLYVMKDIREKNLEMLGIYHSHPSSVAYPSPRDVEMAFYPEVFYVIVSLVDDKKPDVKAFRIVNEEIIGEEIKIER